MLQRVKKTTCYLLLITIQITQRYTHKTILYHKENSILGSSVDIMFAGWFRVGKVRY